MRDVRNRFEVFDCPEKIRRLDQHAGRVVGDRFLKFVNIDASGIRVRHCFQRNPLMGRIRSQHFAILGMQAARDHGRMFPGDAYGHHHGLGCAR